nr:MAG TPA: hypothetical protein [Caudoviricetes sp.]
MSREGYKKVVIFSHSPVNQFPFFKLMIVPYICVDRREALNKRFHIYCEISDKLRGSLS